MAKNITFVLWSDLDTTETLRTDTWLNTQTLKKRYSIQARIMVDGKRCWAHVLKGDGSIFFFPTPESASAGMDRLRKGENPR